MSNNISLSEIIEQSINKEILALHLYPVKWEIYCENGEIDINHNEYFWRVLSDGKIVATSTDIYAIKSGDFEILTSSAIKSLYPCDKSAQLRLAWVDEDEEDGFPLEEDVFEKLDDHHAEIVKILSELIEYKTVTKATINSVGDIKIQLSNNIEIECYKI